MTRKQAILLGISILEKNKKYEEIVQKLYEVAEEYPYKHWTKKAVFDAVEQFRIEHNGRYPTCRDFQYTGLPYHATIKKLFKMSITDFLNHYYPNRQEVCAVRFNHRSASYWLNDFKDTYLSINNGKHVTQQIYNQRRNKNSPCIKTLMKMFHVETYKELKHIAGVDNNELQIVVTYK